MMAALLLLAPLLLLGTAAGQQQAEVTACAGLGNATEGNFSVEATPGMYQANTTYLGKEPCLQIPVLAPCCSHMCSQSLSCFNYF